jgi:hypothetical protein
MDDIIQKSCECLSKIDTAKTENIDIELGLCMISASSPYSEELKKDHNIDMAKIDQQGEDLGRLIGMKMASVCPESLMILAEKMDEKSQEKSTEANTFEGKITGINEKLFIEFVSKADNGKDTKFYWLNYVDSNIKMMLGYKTLLGKYVKITYSSEEFFDPTIEDYRNYNVILTLDQID